LLVVIVFGGGFGGYYILTKMSNNNTVPASVNTNVLNPVSDLSPYTYSLGEILVNLCDEGGKRFFKVDLYLGYDSKKKKEMDMELEEKKPIIRDAINGVLRSKKSTDLSTHENIENLKKEIITRINPYFENGKVSNIYFNNILVQ
jgi:flagellar basal body-associated protein FliL